MRIDRTCQETRCSVLVCCDFFDLLVLLSHGQLLKLDVCNEASF